jgi:hypothetical protein
MAHFAKVNENNIVETVVVVPDEFEDRGQDYLANELGMGGTWVKTSYNTSQGQHLNGGTPVRGNFASVGYTYDPSIDIFMPPRPHPNWKIDYTKFKWVPPVAEPEYKEGFAWRWSQTNNEWIKVAL